MNIDLNKNLNYYINQVKQRNSVRTSLNLANDTYTSLAGRTGMNETEFFSFKSIPEVFSGIYLGLRSKLNKGTLFSGESVPPHFLLNSAALFYASTAILNSLNDDSVRQKRGTNPAESRNIISSSQLGDSSEFSLLETILRNSSRIKPTQDSVELKKNAYSFFEDIYDGSMAFLRYKASNRLTGILSNATISLNGYTFTPPQPPLENAITANGSPQRIASENFEHVPDTLTAYTSDPSVTVDSVIGSTDALQELRAGMIRTLLFNSETGKNILHEFGGRFKTSYILHGPPGVGKNLLVDALINNFKQYVDVDFEACNYTANTASSYKQRGATVLRQYEELQEGSNKIYLNVLDELDGLLGMDQSGNLDPNADAMLQVLKQSVDRSFAGNKMYVTMTNYPDKLEAALKSKSHVIYVPGPQSPYHLAQSVQRELGPYAKNLSSFDLERLSKAMYNKIQSLGGFSSEEQKGCQNSSILYTFRDVKALCEPFVSFNPEELISYEQELVTGSDSQRRRILSGLIKYPTEKDILNSFEENLMRKIDENIDSTSKYNRRG